jgi:hypothetical protein
MTAQLPTRITIEVHPPDPALYGPGDAPGAPVVRVVEGSPSFAQPATAGEPRQDAPMPAAYDPGPCTCLDDEDCGADHAND